jgi:hypothetical protein
LERICRGNSVASSRFTVLYSPFGLAALTWRRASLSS